MPDVGFTRLRPPSHAPTIFNGWEARWPTAPRSSIWLGCEPCMDQRGGDDRDGAVRLSDIRRVPNFRLPLLALDHVGRMARRRASMALRRHVGAADAQRSSLPDLRPRKWPLSFQAVSDQPLRGAA